MDDFFVSLINLALLLAAGLLLVGSFTRLGKIYRLLRRVDYELGEHRSAMKRFNS